MEHELQNESMMLEISDRCLYKTSYYPLLKQRIQFGKKKPLPERVCTVCFHVCLRSRKNKKDLFLIKNNKDENGIILYYLKSLGNF